jgi:hypothetical protein
LNDQQASEHQEENPTTIAKKIATGMQLLTRSKPTNKLVLGRFSINCRATFVISISENFSTTSNNDK